MRYVKEVNNPELTPATRGPRRWPRSWTPGIFHAKTETIAPLEFPVTKWKFALLLTQVGIYACLFAPIQLLIGMQASMITRDYKEMVLSVVTGCGAFMAMFATPIFGALSDRTYSKYGRRAPWVLGGVLFGIFAMMGLTLSWSPWALAGSWVLVQGALNASFIAINAIPNDSVRVEYRGEMGGWLGAGQNLGALLGVGLATLCTSLVDGYQGIVVAYVILALLLTVCVAPYLLKSNDRFLGARRDPISVTQFFRRFWIPPHKYPDFIWTWLSRLFMFTAFMTIALYLLYYLEDVLHYPNPATGVLILSTIYAVLTMITSFIIGFVADYLMKYRRLIFISSVIMGIGSLILAFLQTWTWTIFAAVFIGIGHGIFIAVSFAITTRVLPPTDDSGRDLGVFNMSATFPQVLSPIFGVPVIVLIASYSMGYTVLFGAMTVMFLLGGLMIYKVKSVE